MTFRFFRFPGVCNYYDFFIVFEILNFRQINSTELVKDDLIIAREVHTGPESILP